MTPFLERYSAGRACPGVGWFAPLSGWFLVEMMRLENIRPGILAFATRAPPFWRNAVACALSARVLHTPESFLLRANGDVGDESSDVQVADALMALKPAGILESAYSEVPPGLPAILRKIGSNLLNTPEAYGRLYALLTSEESEQQARRRVLDRLDARLDDEIMHVVQLLPIRLLSPKTVLAVRTATEAHNVQSRVPLIQKMVSNATDEALRQSIEDAPIFGPATGCAGGLLVQTGCRRLEFRWMTILVLCGSFLLQHAAVVASGRIVWLDILLPWPWARQLTSPLPISTSLWC